MVSVWKSRKSQTAPELNWSLVFLQGSLETYPGVERPVHTRFSLNECSVGGMGVELRGHLIANS